MNPTDYRVEINGIAEFIYEISLDSDKTVAQVLEDIKKAVDNYVDPNEEVWK